MYHDILVPFDGSPFSARALPIATALARRTQATMHLVMVHDPSSFIPFVAGEIAVPVYDAELVNERRVEDQRLLDAEAALLSAQGITIVARLLEGTTVEALLEYGREVGADLTVMTTHGRSGFSRLRLGSVATAYLTRTVAPVLLVRGGGSEDLPTVPSGTLLCPLDGSDMSERILPHAGAFAQALGLTLALFSVSVPRAMPMSPFGTELLADPDALSAEEHGRESYLEQMLSQCPPGTTTNAVSDLAVGRAILDEAVRSGAGAVAMATHGRTGLVRLMLGSVADEVVRHTALPVLIYRPDDSTK